MKIRAHQKKKFSFSDFPAFVSMDPSLERKLRRLVSIDNLNQMAWRHYISFDVILDSIKILINSTALTYYTIVIMWHDAGYVKLAVLWVNNSCKCNFSKI